MIRIMRVHIHIALVCALCSHRSSDALLFSFPEINSQHWEQTAQPPLHHGPVSLHR